MAAHPSSLQERFITEFVESQSALQGFCAVSLGDADEAKEVFQKASLVLWRKADHWDPETPFLRWAFSVVRYEIKGHLRDRARDRLVFDDDVVLAMADASGPMVESLSDQSEVLDQCLERLEPRHRETLSEYYVKGFTMSEIAGRQNRSLSAVKAIIVRTRQSLAKCMQLRLAHQKG